MGVLLTTVSTVTINDLGARTFTHPLVNYDLTTEYEYSEIRLSTNLGTELDGGSITLTNNGKSVADSAALKKIQPEPNTDTGGGGGSSLADIWAITTITKI